MKQILNLVFAGFFAIAISSCSKDDNNTGGVSATVAASLKTGTWKITSFVDNGVDETSNFNSFIFTFNSSGTVTATNSVLTANGTWSTGIDDSRHKLLLVFGSPAFFSDISEDWEIVAQSATQVSLRHISGGSGETDLLVFQKM
ncbi:MAG: hypothetical protein EOO06_11050 [Chitinophagaceae bacterium]|nr:MAG: hypothetical protein EOO06_11050 [Chitinophagaceae bacterium]